LLYVVDTHPLVWFLEADARLSRAARDILNASTARLIIPTITLAEIAFLYARHRITIDVAEVLGQIASAQNCVVYPLDEAVVQHLPTTLNIHDGIIIATALVFRDILGEPTTVITKDADITASGLVDVLW